MTEFFSKSSFSSDNPTFSKNASANTLLRVILVTACVTFRR